MIAEDCAFNMIALIAQISKINWINPIITKALNGK